jgi:phage terminase large subunit-like protein
MEDRVAAVSSTLPALSPAEVQQLTRHWDPESKARAMAEVKARTGKTQQVWYCKRGRHCDGEPHDGAPYQHARADQWPPAGKDWTTWALVGGRGSGKTRSGSEYVRKMSNFVERISMIAPTSAAARDTMIEGESGLIRVFERAGETVHYEPSKKRITFPNGGRGTLFSGEEPDRLRGPQHGLVWLDEPAHISAIDEVWDQMLFGLRLGDRPHSVITTTPLPTKWMKARLADPGTKSSKVSTYANLANLAPNFAQTVLSKYEGTRLGRQELHGEILSDVLGALWQDGIIHRLDSTPELARIVISIDPAGTNNRRSDETGIVAVGKAAGFGYVLEDHSDKYSPTGWAKRAIQVYERLKADAIVVEKNYGGDMVKTTIESTAKDMNTPCPRIIVKTAMRSKQLRAEPIVGLYEQTRVLHVGALHKLEEEMVTWVPGKGDSPNRIDALVWALTDLMGVTSDSSISSPADHAPSIPAQGVPPEVIRRSPGGLHLPPGFARRSFTRA